MEICQSGLQDPMDGGCRAHDSAPSAEVRLSISLSKHPCKTSRCRARRASVSFQRRRFFANVPAFSPTTCQAVRGGFTQTNYGIKSGNNPPICVISNRKQYKSGGESESNPHGLSHMLLKHARLPFRHSPALSMVFSGFYS